MGSAAGVVYLIDDDASIREALGNQLESCGLQVVSFGSARDYLNFQRTEEVACVLLDLHLPDISGVELLEKLLDKSTPPIIFISGRADIPSTVRAMKAGAVEFLTKPIEPTALLAAIKSAHVNDRQQRESRAHLASLQRRLALLTPRELEVLPLVIGGFLNKQAAAALGIKEVTLQIHRGQIMRKMGVGSLAELVRMASELGITEERPGACSHADRLVPTAGGDANHVH